MDLRNLKKFFLNEISVDEIVDEINPEVESFRIERAKRGSSSPVCGTNENFQFTVRPEDLRKLGELYLQGQLSEWHLEYLANLLELSLSFSIEDETIADAVFELSSPEVNGPITIQSVRQILKGLQ